MYTSKDSYPFCKASSIMNRDTFTFKIEKNFIFQKYN